MSEESTPMIESTGFAPRQDLDRLRGRALVIGAVGLVAVAAGFFVYRPAFFPAYLVGWLLWTGVAGGLLALGMLSHISGGAWGVMMRRVSEAAGRTLPFMLLFFVPLAFFLPELYPWARPEVVAHDALLQHKKIYLNPGFFLGRTALFLGLWSALGFWLSRLSHRYDETGDEADRVMMQRLSAGGLVVYILTGTLASVDWIMSLDPHWFSSLFGVSFVAGHGLAALAFIVPMMVFLSRRQPLRGLAGADLFHDYGKLMLAFTMLWAYFMVSQYLIIWSGNLPEEIIWYLHRNQHGWKTLSVLLVIGHFALPFILLLSADRKREPRRLLRVAVWVLAMRWLDYCWQVLPAFELEHGIWVWVLALAAACGVGGIWLWLLLGQLRGRSLLPVREPILKEALVHG